MNVCMLSLFLHGPGPNPRHGAAHSGLGPPTSVNSLDNPTNIPTGQPGLDSPSLRLFAGDCSVKLTVRTNITAWKNSLVRLVPQEYLVSTEQREGRE